MDQGDQVKNILTKISDELGVEVVFAQDTQDNGKVIPALDVNAMISKMVALFVFSGLGVPSSFAPPYNRVHADIEWWKKRFEETAKPPAPPAAG